MFTGIVTEVGIVRGVSEGGFVIQSSRPMNDLLQGDSICVSGACLTVVEIDANTFSVDTVPETIRRTSFSTIRQGDGVNLEAALTANGKMGGHFVQGHVDEVGQITEIRPDGEATMVDISCSQKLLTYIVEKGFITIEGVSLTVVSVNANGFQVTLIPFTRTHTTLGSKDVGGLVNLEVDILAKYVERILAQSGKSGDNASIEVTEARR